MRNILFYFVLVLLVSCGLNDKTKEKEKLEQQKKERSEIIERIVSNYNIAYCWDTLDYSYSIDFKPVICSNYQLIENYEIKDIYEKEGFLYVSISVGFYPEYYFDFPISQEQENILEKEKDEIIVCDRVLVVCITDIRKVKFTLEGKCDEDGASVNLEDSFAFIGKGKLIDIISTTKK